MSNNIKAFFDKLYIGNTEFDSNSNVNITGNVSISNNLIIGLGSYLSFNGSNNASLYGIKDDNGTLKYKNSSGDWRYFSTIINGYINFPNENGVYPDNNLVQQEAGFGLRDNNGVLEFKNRTGTSHTNWTTIGTDQIVPTTINTLTCNADYSLANFKLINVGDATLLTDGINKKYVDQTVFNSINSYLVNNSVQIQKLFFDGDGTSYLSNDGTFKIISGGSGGSGGSGDIISDVNFNTKGGTSALTKSSLSTCLRNTAFGYQALQNTNNTDNIAIGYLASKDNTGFSNIGIGYQSSQNNTGNNNIGIGYNSLQNNNGSLNIGIGLQSLQYNTSGVNNIALGYNSLTNNTTGYNNVCIGTSNSSINTTGYNNVSIGSQSMCTNSTGYRNVAIGDMALFRQTTGVQNTAVGYNALSYVTTAYGNIAIGTNAGQYINSNHNICIGAYGSSDTNAYFSTYIGFSAGAYNAYYNCTFIGYYAGTYNSQIGLYGAATGPNQIWLGNSDNYVYSSGYYLTSDSRDKALIRDTLLGLDFINKVRPVDFKWNYREDYVINKEVEKTRIVKEIIKETVFDTETGEQKEIEKEVEREEKYIDNEIERLVNDGSKIRNRYHHGVIAQDIKQIIQETGIDFGGYQDHTFNGGSEKMTIGYSEFIGPIIKAIQELSQLNNVLESKVNVLESKNNVLESKVNDLENKNNDLLSRIINIENRLSSNNN